MRGRNEQSTNRPHPTTPHLYGPAPADIEPDDPYDERFVYSLTPSGARALDDHPRTDGSKDSDPAQEKPTSEPDAPEASEDPPPEDPADVIDLPVLAQAATVDNHEMPWFALFCMLMVAKGGHLARLREAHRLHKARVQARRRGRRAGTVSRRWHGDEKRPLVRLSGKWLRRAGFDVGAPFEVEVSKDRLVLRRV